MFGQRSLQQREVESRHVLRHVDQRVISNGIKVDVCIAQRKIEIDKRRLIWIWTHDLIDWVRMKAWTWLP